MLPMPNAKTVNVILRQLHQERPHATYELHWETPLQLLVATILAAQCPDERVNQVTETLFPKYPDAAAFANADLKELEEDVRPTGFYRKKAQRIIDVCRALVANFGGRVPRTMEEMLTLPGVARKTANVVLNVAYGEPSGVIVDSHVQRAAQRMGLTRQTKPEKIEEDLMALLPQDEWVFFGPALVLHGRYVCTARKPKCDECGLAAVCPKVGLE
jgi:endonuclease-3